MAEPCAPAEGGPEGRVAEQIGAETSLACCRCGAFYPILEANVSARQDGSTHLTRLAAAVRRLADDFDRDEFVPLLEADVDSYLLHIPSFSSNVPILRLCCIRTPGS